MRMVVAGLDTHVNLKKKTKIKHVMKESASSLDLLFQKDRLAQQFLMDAVREVYNAGQLYKNHKIVRHLVTKAVFDIM